ncbi:hypothetical protein SLA2020_230700 [Shorea laevis]
MALKLSSPCNCSSFSESEMDVARQLIQLCRDDDDNIIFDNEGNREKGKRKQINCEEDDASPAPCSSSSSSSSSSPLKRRKKRFRSIHFIYRSTKPLIVFRLGAA